LENYIFKFGRHSPAPPLYTKGVIIFIKYIKKLFTKWILLLGLLPSFYDYISAYFNTEIVLPETLKIIFIILIFIIASFSVWNDERKKNIELHNKLKNPVDYKITAHLKEISFDFNIPIQKIDTFIENIDRELAKIDIKLQERQNKNEFSHLQDIVYSMQSIDTVTTKTEQTYIRELLDYKDELISFKNNYDLIKNNMITNISNEINKFYKISFYIENIGRKSDSDINIEILSKDINILNKYIVGSNINKNGINYPTEPEPPKRRELTSFESRMPPLPNFEHPMAYRKNQSIEENRIFITLRDMNVGDKLLVIKNTLFIQQHDNLNMTFTIKSKESEAIIKKYVEILYDKEKYIYNKS